MIYGKPALFAQIDNNIKINVFNTSYSITL